MKKCGMILLLVALLGALVLPGHAAQNRLKVDDVTVKPGETVYLKLKLTESTVGDAMGVTYTYDPAVLKPLESSSTWAKQALLQDMDAKKKAGVWAVEEAEELKGLVCTLAFQVVSEEEHFDTKVTCTLSVKKDSEDVGVFTADVKVSTYCDHEYGRWQNKSTLGHTRQCVSCGRSQTRSHNWDDGTTTQVAGKPGMAVTVYSCPDCGATQEFEHTSEEKPTIPPETQPEVTDPDDPYYPTEDDHEIPTYPGHDHDHGTDSTKPEDDDDGPLHGFDGDSSDATLPDFNEDHKIPTYPDHDHDHGTVPTQPAHDHDHDHGTVPTQPAHDHDHSAEVLPPVDSATRTRNGLIVLGILVVLICGAYFYSKKKRR